MRMYAIIVLFLRVHNFVNTHHVLYVYSLHVSSSGRPKRAFCITIMATSIANVQLCHLLLATLRSDCCGFSFAYNACQFFDNNLIS